MHLFTFNIKSTKHNKDGATSAAVECYMLLHKYNQVISISLAQLNHIIYHIIFCIIIHIHMHLEEARLWAEKCLGGKFLAAPFIREILRGSERFLAAARFAARFLADPRDF